MNPQYLELSRSQLAVSWKRSRFNHYSDSRKQRFHENLGELYEKLMAVDFTSSYRKDDLHFFRNVLEFFKSSLAALDNNTISSVPHEIIECLNIAARQWLSDFDDYIIVMTDGPYAIIPQVEDYRLFYILVKTKLGVEFKNILLTVQMPRQLSRDYLTNVCLFHELGHFVDTKLHISERTYTDSLLLKWMNKKKTSEINKWFSNGTDAYQIVATPIGPRVAGISQSVFYLKEYFADLFGSQYVGDNIFNYIEYLDDEPQADGPVHPSDDKRRRMYIDFTKGVNTNPVVEALYETTLAQSKHGLVKKYIDLDTTEMCSFIPTTLSNEQQLLSIFNMGWGVYKSGSLPFEKANDLQQPLSPDKRYECINNLIEKSINNYLIVRDWKFAKSKI